MDADSLGFVGSVGMVVTPRGGRIGEGIPNSCAGGIKPRNAAVISPDCSSIESITS